jgi:hypothetical protein
MFAAPTLADWTTTDAWLTIFMGRCTWGMRRCERHMGNCKRSYAAGRSLPDSTMNPLATMIGLMAADKEAVDLGAEGVQAVDAAAVSKGGGDVFPATKHGTSWNINEL